MGRLIEINQGEIMKHKCESYKVTCGNCGNSWCEKCDPAPSALCHTCHGRGHSLKPLKPAHYAGDEDAWQDANQSFNKTER